MQTGLLLIKKRKIFTPESKENLKAMKMPRPICQNVKTVQNQSHSIPLVLKRSNTMTKIMIVKPLI